MKIQCSCGTKYAFDITPEMAADPVRLVCQNCGADNSASVNQIIQQQFAATTPASEPPPASVPAAGPAPRVRVQVHTAAPVASAAASPTPPMCLKHPGNFTADHCRVCGKPICPQCMSLFGYICSAFCKSEAERRGLDLPVYENLSSRIAARQTRKLGRIFYSGLAVLLLLLGAYAWYLFVGAQPHVVFSAQFRTPAYSGASRLYERDSVLLHGGHLARYDWRSKKKIWGVDLLDPTQVAAQADEELRSENNAREAWIKEGRPGSDMGYVPSRHTKEEIVQMLLASAKGEFTLYVQDQNIWLRSRGKLVQYDWATGKAGKEVPLPGQVRHTAPAQDSLLFLASTASGEELMKFDWKTGEATTQRLTERTPPAATPSGSNKLAGTNRLMTAARAGSRTNVAPILGRGAPANAALKGYKVAQPDPLAVRIAAPAIAANAVQNKRIERELGDNDDAAGLGFDFAAAGPRFINDHGNIVEFSVKLLEAKTITRQAMKAPPKKSALEGEVNQAATAAIANEILNKFQREVTGGVEQENVSRYEVAIKRIAPEAAQAKLEVIGSPEFFPLNTVDLLVAGKTLIVLDKAAKKLWESKLSFDIAGGFGESDWGGELIATASAPGVERDGALYFFDKGVLACFDLATGNARWRQPTVGVTKLLFDDKGMLYVDTTSGSVDSVRFSQQVDISQKRFPVIIKIDPKTGKALWRSDHAGRLSHVFGKLVYTMEWHGGDDDAGPGGPLPGLQVPPHIRIRRLSASNGKVQWEYYQKRAPLSVDIRQNTIQLLFKKEMQVLKFIAL